MAICMSAVNRQLARTERCEKMRGGMSALLCLSDPEGAGKRVGVLLFLSNLHGDEERGEKSKSKEETPNP